MRPASCGQPERDTGAAADAGFTALLPPLKLNGATVAAAEAADAPVSACEGAEKAACI